MIKDFDTFIRESRLGRILNNSFSDSDNMCKEDERKWKTTFKPIECEKLMDFLNEYLKGFDEWDDDGCPWFGCDDSTINMTKDSIMYVHSDGVKDKFCTMREIISFIQGDMLIFALFSVKDDVLNKMSQTEIMDLYDKESELNLCEWLTYIKEDYTDNSRLIGSCILGDNFKYPYRKNNSYFGKCEFGTYKNRFGLGIQ